jgi:hypothetical protein
LFPSLILVRQGCGSSCCRLQGSGGRLHMDKQDFCAMGSWETYIYPLLPLQSTIGTVAVIIAVDAAFIVP